MNRDALKMEMTLTKSKIAMNLRWKVVQCHKEEILGRRLSENYQETWKLRQKLGGSHVELLTHQTPQVTKNINQVGRQRQNSNAMEKEEDL